MTPEHYSHCDFGIDDTPCMDKTITVETRKQRIDRELIELLNEIRVALPGVQVLFGFLLIAPFQSTWRDQTHDLQTAAYFVALIAAFASSLTLITPSALHRLNFRHANKERLLEISNGMLIVGMAFLGLSMSAALLLVTDMLLPQPVAIAMGAVALVAFTGMWVVFPLLMRRGSDMHDGSEVDADDVHEAASS